MSEEEKKAIEILKNTRQAWCRILSRYIDKQQKLINTFIHNEAVKEGKDFNEIKEKYYECL